MQGKQLDVIILSCVRALAPGASMQQQATIGFLADTRRLNVAITRAKRALWVLGHAQSLSRHSVWRALVEDADRRGCLVRTRFGGGGVELCILMDAVSGKQMNEGGRGGKRGREGKREEGREGRAGAGRRGTTHR